MAFTRDAIKLDSEKETERLVDFMRQQVRAFRRGGAVVGV